MTVTATRAATLSGSRPSHGPVPSCRAGELSTLSRLSRLSRRPHPATPGLVPRPYPGTPRPRSPIPHSPAQASFAGPSLPSPGLVRRSLAPQPRPRSPAVAFLHPLKAQLPKNVARNSPTAISIFEFRSLKSRGFQRTPKLTILELRATFKGRRARRTDGISAAQIHVPRDLALISATRRYRQPRCRPPARRGSGTPARGPARASRPRRSA